MNHTNHHQHPPLLPAPKKGLSLEVMAILILFVMVFSLMLLFLQRYTTIATHRTDRTLCSQSVAIHAGKPLEVFRGSITCPPEHIQIPYSLSSPTGQEHAKEQLAQALYTCAQDFGHGTSIDLFTRQGIYCNVCSWIDFDDQNGKIPGLVLYLANTTIPFHDVSFLDYLSAYQTPHFRDYINRPELFNAAQGSISDDIPTTKNRYAVLYVYARGEDSINRLKDLLAPSAGGTGGRLLGVGTAGVIAGTGGAAVPFLLLGFGPAGWITAGLSSISISGLTLYGFSTFTDKPQRLTFARLMPYSEQSFQQLGCEYLEIKTT